MKRSRFSEEQIGYAIRQAESGTPVGDFCRQRSSAAPSGIDGALRKITSPYRCVFASWLMLNLGLAACRFEGWLVDRKHVRRW